MTTEEITSSERYRRERAQQVEERRAAIITAAADLFLEKGLEETTMLNIAERVNISKMTLYRYFPNRDPIAFEVAAQMLKSIISIASQNVDDEATTMGAIEGLCLGMIREFFNLRGAYRYMGMFDHLYGDNYPSDELAAWYKQHIFSLEVDGVSPLRYEQLEEHTKTQVVTLLNMLMSFLEKMAARGELMAEEQEVPLLAQLEVVEEITLVYLKSLDTGK